ncbi:(R)-limonene synthase 1, chloroplastic-like [Mangifera indica]|uniref:(R)-limonene synthase 1, chloroplastic-like n=1 Tax=Mangifera indica TaxID=29780 RepID=UPI001CF9CD4E|nr:(R)-limonene synthase 1, chloroplastic-like [Mangifera indica]XP_044508019.1 (R)-limonene synthase 1, chloroplastic-like [Mangifera indica]
MANAYVSITGPAMSTLVYLSATSPIVEKEVDFIESHPPLVKLASKVLRLQDDLGTATDELKRGDVLKAVQCYMNETGCSEEAGREHIQQLTRQWWKKLNLLRTSKNSPIPKNITEMILNLARSSHLVYLHGEDGHGVEGQVIMNVMTSMLLQPIP